MKVGLIGARTSGRSTLFEALTGRPPSPGGKGQLGIARVMDDRLDRLTELCQPRRTVHAEVVLSLPPSPPAGAVEIAALREARDLKAYAHVVGAFSCAAAVDVVPAAMRELSTELLLADMERVETRQTRIGKGGNARTREDELLTRARACLDRERPLRLEPWDEQLALLMDELGLVSHRHLITVVNVAEDQLGAGCPAPVAAAARETGGEVMWLCATLEAEIAALGTAEEQREFLAAYGLSRPVSQRFVQTAFALLDQICFFTVGSDEVRAWPVARGTAARRAARTIHSDLERGFIRAEVISYPDFVQHGSEARCKAAGVLRTEGKDYVVQDGDIITVRFNV